MSRLAIIGSTHSASTSIAHRRLHKSQPSDLFINMGNGTFPSIALPALPTFDSELELPESPSSMTPKSYSSGRPSNVTPSHIKDTQSIPKSPSSRRSSFSDIEDDDDYSSECSIDIFQARREMVKRVQPQRLRWEAGSLRREYVKQQASGSQSLDSIYPESKSGGASSSNNVAKMERSDTNATSFFHHNTLRRHNSTGNYTQEQLSKSDLAEESTTIQEKSVNEVSKIVKSGGSPSQRKSDSKTKYPSSRQRRASYLAQIQVSSRSSSLPNEEDQQQIYNNLEITPVPKLPIEFARKTSFKQAPSMPPTPPESSAGSIFSSEAHCDTAKIQQQQPSDFTATTTHQIVSLPTQSKSSLSKPTFSVKDKLFSGIKGLR